LAGIIGWHHWLESLAGIIDFDGIIAVPRYFSNGYRGSYPHWLTREEDLYEGPKNDTANFPVTVKSMTTAVLVEGRF